MAHVRSRTLAFQVWPHSPFHQTSLLDVAITSPGFRHLFIVGCHWAARSGRTVARSLKPGGHPAPGAVAAARVAAACASHHLHLERMFVASKKSTKWPAAFEHFGRHAAHYISALPSIRATSMRWLAPLNSTSLPWWTILSIMAEASLSSPRTVPHFENSMFVVNTMLRLS